MQVVDQSGTIAESSFRLFRFLVQCLIFITAVGASRWGIDTFLLNRRGRSDRWRHSWAAANLVVLVLLLFLRGPATTLVTSAGDALSRLSPKAGLAWLSGMLVGLYYALIATTILF